MRAFVTGGTSGFGYALVSILLDNGWKVATCGRRQNIIDEMKSSMGDDLLAFPCDIRFDNHIESAYSRIKDAFESLDLLVLNAGDLGPVPLRGLLETSLIDLRKTFETNFFANFNIVSKFSSILDSPSLIAHVTSDAATSSYPGWGAYGSSKAAMDHLVSILHEEVKETGKKAVSFDPGDMNTDMHRRALPEDDPKTLKDPRTSAEEFMLIVREHLEAGR